MKPFALALFCFALAGALPAQDAPRAEISNGSIRAKLLLPDKDKGYYRSTRFDWSGAIESLEFKGHNFFGQWFPKYDPKINDATMGPVEEFDEPLGFADAQPGGVFAKIGVGALKKPEGARPYSKFTVYDIADNGKWTVRTAADSVEFTQELTDAAGYGWVYRKVVRLEKGKPVLTMEHSLRNTGKKPIETTVYDHDFYMIDARPSGPEYVVKFPFEVKSEKSLGQGVELSGKELRYTQELQRGSAYGELTGFGASPSDYDIRVENRKAGAGVRQTSDRPLAKLVYWSIRTTACPEAYIALKVAPGQETKWRISWEFYTFPPAE